LKKDSEPIFTSKISLWDGAKTYLKNKEEHDVQSFLAPSATTAQIMHPGHVQEEYVKG